MTLESGGFYKIGNIVIGTARYNVTQAFSGNVLTGLPSAYSGSGTTNYIVVMSNKEFGSYLMDLNGNVKCDNVSTGALLLSFCYVTA